jgi:hypothetical protein
MNHPMSVCIVCGRTYPGYRTCNGLEMGNWREGGNRHFVHCARLVITCHFWSEANLISLSGVMRQLGDTYAALATLVSLISVIFWLFWPILPWPMQTDHWGADLSDVMVASVPQQDHLCNHHGCWTYFCNTHCWDSIWGLYSIRREILCCSHTSMSQLLGSLLLRLMHIKVLVLDRQGFFRPTGRGGVHLVLVDISHLRCLIHPSPLITSGSHKTRDKLVLTQWW